MSINKFGISLHDDNYSHSFDATSYSQNNLILNNVLCLNGESYDAKNRKIICVADPQKDTDVANKVFVNTSFNLLKQNINELKKSNKEFKTGITQKIEELSKRIDDAEVNVKIGFLNVSSEIHVLRKSIQSSLTTPHSDNTNEQGKDKAR